MGLSQTFFILHAFPKKIQKQIYLIILTFMFVRLQWQQPTFNFSIPAVVSQSVINKSCLICVKSEKDTFLGITRPLGSMRWEKAELHTLRH